MGGSGWRALRDRANPDMMAGDSLLVQTSPVALPGVLLMDRKPPVVDQNQGPEGKEGCRQRRKKGGGADDEGSQSCAPAKSEPARRSPPSTPSRFSSIGWRKRGARCVVCVCVCV